MKENEKREREEREQSDTVSQKLYGSDLQYGTSIRLSVNFSYFFFQHATGLFGYFRSKA